MVLWYFMGTPLERIGNLLSSATLGLLMLSGVLLVATGRCVGRYGKLMILLIAAALVIPVYSSIRAYYYFGQPLFYGVLAERHWWGLAFGPLLYHFVVAGKLHTEKMIVCFKWLAWVSLAGYLLTVCIYLFGGAEVQALFKLTAISNSDHRGLRTNLPMFPIVFGAAYYLAMAAREKPLPNLLKSGLFIFYVFFIARGRIDMACVALALIFAIYTSGILSRWRILLGVGIFYVLLGSLIPQYGADSSWLLDRFTGKEAVESAEPAETNAKTTAAKTETKSTPPTNNDDNISARTYQDVKALLEGDAAIDHGLNARRKSLDIVGTRLIESPTTLLFGAGRVSNRWQGGFSGVLETWFYPLELGFIGAIFVYGLLLYLAVTLSSLLLSWNIFRGTSGYADPGLIAFRWVLVYWLVRFISGVPLLLPTQFFLTLFICLALKHGLNRSSL